MEIACLDLEGVLVPEIWIAFAEKTGIEELKATTRDIPDYGLVMGVPGRLRGWMSRHGHRLTDPDDEGVMICPESSYRYREENGTLCCLDLGEDEPLPPELSEGRQDYHHFKNEPRP